MPILWMMIIGFAVGTLALLLMPGRDSGGVMITILVSISGSILAGVTGRSMGWYTEGEPVGFVASVLGAILVLAVYRVIKPQRDSRKRRINKAAQALDVRGMIRLTQTCHRPDPTTPDEDS
jgi:uncharacterized membrane protein YeaQ/YmgE (transglycosylase-associated protein family)